ncbi:enterochelin esterase [Streptomyces corynorhini]|uniref:Enterochelin esterase n=1 Tax=Streptomyces corynorhini TaxID=2282652 RepID=A0A370AMW3_9ACTN|nr:enterochelin esterase [Streptomyces corynorhini]RDG30938.1 enterochelin esterase [Streptomyces corynorhini]
MIASPAIERLAARLAAAPAGEHSALVEEFWAAVRRGGTPLVEALQDAPGHRAVTFLWRGHRATRQVLLVANRIGDREHLAGSLFTHLTGTDVWHLSYRLRGDHRASYQIAADISPGELPSDPGGVQRRLRALSAHAAADPLNTDSVPARWKPARSSVFALPEAPAQPWHGRRAGIARGTVERHRIPSAALGCERDVWGYLPPGRDHADLPVLALCDGDMWFGGLRLQETLDALIADGRVPPFAVLAPDAVDNPTRWGELGGRDEYVAFLADEVLPWASERLPLTADPARTVLAGQSLGGVSALYAGLRRPDRFGNVLAHSASLWWRPGLAPGIPEQSMSGTPWIAGLYAETRRPPLRVRLDVGLHEGPMVGQHRALCEVLRSRGHDVTHTEFNGGHDYVCWRGALADGLVATLGNGDGPMASGRDTDDGH